MKEKKFIPDLTLFSSVMDIVKDAFIAIDDKYYIILFNKGAESKFGYIADETIGKHIKILLTHSFSINHIKHLESFQNSRETATQKNQWGKLFCRHKDGTDFEADVRFAKGRIDNNRIIFINLESTNYKNSIDKSIIASEIRYRRLFESTKDGILILDAENGKIVDVNPFLIELLGYSKDIFLTLTH